MFAIRDDHLERLIEQERARRGDSTKTKTAADLIREYLTILKRDSVSAYQSRDSDSDTKTPEPATA